MAYLWTVTAVVFGIAIGAFYALHYAFGVPLEGDIGSLTGTAIGLVAVFVIIGIVLHHEDRDRW